MWYISIFLNKNACFTSIRNFESWSLIQLPSFCYVTALKCRAVFERGLAWFWIFLELSQTLSSPNTFRPLRLPVFHSVEFSPTPLSLNTNVLPQFWLSQFCRFSPNPLSASCLFLSCFLLPSVSRLPPTPGSPHSSRHPGAWVGSEPCLLASAKPRVARMAGSLKWECPP